MNTGDIITAAELKKIIETHGAGVFSVDGSTWESFESAASLELDGTESFGVVINYGHEVQFHLISDDMRAIVTTGLKGRCDDIHGWMA